MTNEGEDDDSQSNIRKYPEEVTVETKKERAAVVPKEVTIDVEIPDGAGAEAIIKQDITGNGESDESQRVILADGKHTYELDKLDQVSVHTWTEFVLKSLDGQESPSISSYSLTGSKVSD